MQRRQQPEVDVGKQSSPLTVLSYRKVLRFTYVVGRPGIGLDVPAVGNLAFCLFVLFLVEVAVPGSPSLIVLVVSVDVKQY